MRLARYVPKLVSFDVRVVGEIKLIKGDERDQMKTRARARVEQSER